MLRIKITEKKLNITCWYHEFIDGRHFETQNNHVYVWDLHYQSENVRIDNVLFNEILARI